jgi:PRC-barrel domain
MRGRHAFALAATVAAVLAALPVALEGLRAEDAPSTTVNEPPSTAPAPQTPTPQPPTPQPPAPPAPASVTVLNKHEVQGVLGREVLSAANENMGRIVDVMVDSDGRVRAAIIDFGGFLGVGSRKIAVDWSALHFPVTGKPDERVTLDLNRDQVNAAPAYEDGKPVIVLGALGKLEPLPFE